MRSTFRIIPGGPFLHFFEHNLNAAAIGGLSTEMAGIEADIEQLINDRRASIAEADRFLRALPE